MMVDILELFFDDYICMLISIVDIEVMYSLSDSLCYEFDGEMIVDSVEVFIDSCIQVVV